MPEPLLQSERLRLARALGLHFDSTEAQLALTSEAGLEPGGLPAQGQDPTSWWSEVLDRLEGTSAPPLTELIGCAHGRCPADGTLAWASRRLEGRPLERPSSALPEHPYRLLRPFGPADSALYFGREEDLGEASRRLMARSAPTLWILTGPSGAGKSSFLQAALLPTLHANGWQVDYERAGAEPAEALSRMGHRLDGRFGPPTAGRGQPRLLALDQAEEMFTLGEGAAAFLEGLGASLQGERAAEAPSRLLLSVREDFFQDLTAPFHALERGVDWDTLTLGSLSRDGLERALLGPAGQAEGMGDALSAEVRQRWRFAFAPGLAKMLSEALAQDERGPVAVRMQVLGGLLWERIAPIRPEGAPYVTTEADIAAIGGARGVLERYVERVLSNPATFPDESHRDAARLLLWALIRQSEGRPTAGAASLEELSSKLSRLPPGLLLGTLAELKRRWVIEETRPEGGAVVYRLAHDGIAAVVATWADQEILLARQDVEEGCESWTAAGRPPEGWPPLEPESEALRRAARLAARGIIQSQAEGDYLAAALATEARARSRRRRRRVLAVLGTIAVAILGGAALVLLFAALWMF